MAIASTLHPGHFQNHLINRKQKSKKTKRIVVAGLMLTSMVDMFSLLVIFLLQSFSSQPTTMNLSQHLILPSAMTASSTQDAPVLTVTELEITLDEKPVGKTSDLIKNPTALVTLLDQIKSQWMKAHPTENFIGSLNFQADEKLSSTLISQVMSIAQSQGYQSIQLAVVGGGQQ